VPRLIVPYLRRTSRELVDIGLPEDHAYEAEALWQTLKNILRKVEDEGMYAWRSATLLPPFRNHAKPFGLQNCVLN
jgi:hypothetical protein